MFLLFTLPKRVTSPPAVARFIRLLYGRLFFAHACLRAAGRSHTLDGVRNVYGAAGRPTEIESYALRRREGSARVIDS